MAEPKKAASSLLHWAVIAGVSIAFVDSVGASVLEAVFHRLEQRENALLRSACLQSGGTILVDEDERVHCFGCAVPKAVARQP
ncbi:MAG TPA: hypothetical protein VKY73_11975 [Polyangiaceae bacterium]|nr:hypothetical protein [Polyangiaceae bacterium]